MKLANLPESHADDVQQPCDWCGQSILHEHPPAQVLLTAGNFKEKLKNYESRSWRLCEQCLDALIDLVKTRVAGV